ncbi:Putative transposase R104 [Picochlorum sp. SENEW3]|nr:Putative transposase R104 [Picochlorum sp. SENEW3]
MCRDKKQPSISESLVRPLSNGRTMTASNMSCSQVDKGIMGLRFKMVSNKRKSVTVEYHRAGKKMTLSDRSGICLVGRSSPISEADSIGTEKAFDPFFNDRCKEASRLLRSLTRTDLLGSGSISSNSCWHEKELGSSAILTTNINQEKKNSSMISFQLSRSSVKKFMVGESTKDGLTRIRRIEIFPTKDQLVLQERVLNQWFGACRYTYNECVGFLNNLGTIPTKKNWFQWLRNRFVTNKNIQGSKVWLLSTPKHIREGAIKDFQGAYKAALTNRKRKNIERFRMGFRKKSDSDQSILIQKGPSGLRIDHQGVHIYKRSLQGVLRVRQSIEIPVHHDCRLMKTKGKFYLAIPVHVPREEKVMTISNYCAIDPGVRTFGSIWSPEGTSELGLGFATKLYPRLVALDKLRSSIDTEPDHRKRKRKKMAFERLTGRFQSILKDFHFKAAHYLCSMEILIQTAERMGENVFVIGEEYTTKTCCRCGILHETLGGSKVFACKSCCFHADRDILAAFNIFLKFLKETSASICW